MKRTANAQWQGDFKNGKGALTTQSGILNKTAYSFKTRFEDGVGTNPEELLAAAHAGCFTMAVDVQLTQKGLVPEMLETIATVDLDMVALKITGIHLEIKAKVNGLSEEVFQNIATDAKATCVISKALSVPITMTALLEK
jgi:osmotically inducible protein OsmC